MEQAEKVPLQARRHEPVVGHSQSAVTASSTIDHSERGISLGAQIQMLRASPQVQAQRALNNRIAGSAYVSAQRKLIAGQSREPVQRQSGEGEELIQGRLAPLQRAEFEEDEQLQGRFTAAQRAEADEEDLLQGKFDAVQRANAEEELLQGKFGTVQRAGHSAAQRANETGLPDNLKGGIEALSGISLDNVRVHYNSSRPAQLSALAYAQGTDIHVAPGQERHLPHEAWHVVQQAQGRVRPTMQLKGGVPVNDDAELEREADVMGERALQTPARSDQPPGTTRARMPALQRMTARIMRNEGRAPTAQEIANARDSGIANSQRLAGHGRPRHGRQVEVPADVQAQQAAADRQAAIDQAIQLKSHQDNHSKALSAQQTSLQAIKSSPMVIAQHGRLEGLAEAAQLRSDSAQACLLPEVEMGSPAISAIQRSSIQTNGDASKIVQFWPPYQIDDQGYQISELPNNIYTTRELAVEAYIDLLRKKPEIKPSSLFIEEMWPGENYEAGCAKLRAGPATPPGAEKIEDMEQGLEELVTALDELTNDDAVGMPLEGIISEYLADCVSTKMGDCADCTEKAWRKLLKSRFGRPFGVSGVLVDFETKTMIRNHTALIASWDDVTYVIDTTMGQFTGIEEVWIGKYFEWLDTLLDAQPQEVERYEVTIKSFGYFSDDEMNSRRTKFRGNEKIGSGFRDNGESETTEESKK